MKLTFKDWNVIHAALTTEAEKRESDLKWHKEYYANREDASENDK